MIVRGTTPVIRFNFKVVNPQTFVVAYLTIEQDKITILEKPIEEATIGDRYIEWPLTQEDTLLLDYKKDVSIQCRYKDEDEVAGASKIYTMNPYHILKEGVI